MTRRLLAALAAIAGSAVACASFKDGDAPDVAPIDASAPFDGAAGRDGGGADAAEADAGKANDAGVDPCGDRSASPKLSAGFDAPAEPWEFGELVRLSSGTEEFVVVTGAGLDGKALRVSARDGAATSHNTWLRTGFGSPGTATRLRLDFDFIVEAAGHDYAVLGGLFFQSSGTVKDFGIVGTPHHATICALRESGPNVRRIVRIDDTVVDDRSDLLLGDPTDVEVRIGIFYTSYQLTETRVLYDDVEIRID